MGDYFSRRFASPAMPMRKVLLIDDETEICYLLSKMLQRAGADCRVAHTLQDGSNALSQEDFDLVFLDIHLPDGLGYDLIPTIRGHQPRARVIAISAVDAERGRAVAQGADLFLPKPFDKDTIMASLRKLGV